MKGIEKSFLTNWNGWDEVDTGDLQFYEVELNFETKEAMRCSMTEDEIDSIHGMYFSSQSSIVEFYNKAGDSVYRRNVLLKFAP